MHGLDVELLPLAPDSPDELLDAWHGLYAELLREQVPEMGPAGRAEAVGRLLTNEDERVEGRLAFVGDKPVGGLALSLWQAEDRELAYVELVVMPEHRRKGVGRRLIEEAARSAAADGRKILNSDVQVGSAAEAVGRALGARETLRDVRSRLDVTGVDIEALRAATSVVPDGYRLVSWTGPCPEELVEAMALAQEAINDRPMGTGSHEPARWDADRVRRRERRQLASGLQQVATVAVHTSGAVAGLTEIEVPEQPPGVWQENTSVVRAHRGRGLGLILKAANLLQLRERHPDARWAVTWNAADNRHMRAVNEQLGYQVCDEWVEMELTCGD